MGARTLLVVGAAGDVGRGVVASALDSGRQVIAAGRSAGALSALAGDLACDRLATIQGDLADEAGASRLWESAAQAFGGIDDVVVSVNAPFDPRPLAEMRVEDVAVALSGNVLTHFAAAKAFLPRMREAGMFIGIGGGTADFIFPGLAPVSMAQAALRMLYRGLAKERKSGPRVRELMIVSMVAGTSNRETAQDDWVTDREVGRHIVAILDEPEKFPRPVLHLRSRAQVGHPEIDA